MSVAWERLLALRRGQTPAGLPLHITAIAGSRKRDGGRCTMRDTAPCVAARVVVGVDGSQKRDIECTAASRTIIPNNGTSGTTRTMHAT
mmetsp:Transcript_5840/g.11042  ORF Transcript_5840/g.11042 Transcript_5840/m.11042 type:complete len:89 (-) Transcript_5840:8-274(-)